MQLISTIASKLSSLPRCKQLIPTLLTSENDSDQMVPVPDITIGLGVYGFPNRELQLGPYSIGKYEVTNEEFKEFVDDGAYNPS